MPMKSLIAALALTFSIPLSTSPAQAQETKSVGWREAQVLIDGTGVPQLFENLSDESEMKVRHRSSGLVCTYVPGAALNSLMVFPSSLPSGDDVGCNTDMGPIQATYYATRYGAGYSARDSARDAAAGIRNRWPDARPYEGASATVSPPEGVGETAFGAFLVGQGDRTQYTHVVTAKVGEWIFKQRMTGTAETDAVMGNQIMAGVFWNSVLGAAVKQ